MKIFCYGTLQDSKVQLELLGKTFIGKVSSIDNYIIVRDYIDPTDGIEYPRIVNFDKGCVYGNIYDFTEEEVKILDEYETSLYFKKEIILNCNTKCLCYFPVI